MPFAQTRLVLFSRLKNSNVTRMLFQQVFRGHHHCHAETSLPTRSIPLPSIAPDALPRSQPTFQFHAHRDPQAHATTGKAGRQVWVLGHRNGGGVPL